MTEEEGKNIVKSYVDNIAKKSSWWFLNRRRFYLEFSKIFEPYQKEANLLLRDELSFPHFTMSKFGLNFGDSIYEWSEIFGVAVKTEEKHNTTTEETYFIKHLIFCTADATVKEFMLGDTSYLKNLLPHFIELYKIEFIKNIMPKNLDEIITPELYFKKLTITFPEIREKVEGEDGERFKMEQFADYTIKQIKTNNISELKRCFDFQDEKISLCPALENAMVISYCESLLLGDVAPIIHNFTSYMRPKLFKMYNDYRILYFDMVEKSNKKK